MRTPFPHGRQNRRWHRARGFSLAEMLVLTAVLAIVSAVVLRSSGQSLKREELNAITVELYGWLEGIQRKAMSVDPSQRAANPDQFPTCRVTFNTGSLRPGSVLASTPGFCSPDSSERDGQAVFLLPNTNANKSFDVQTFNGNAVTFSPRGTVTFFADGGNDPAAGPLTLEITRQGSSLTRCLRVERLLGFLAIGAVNNQDPTEAQDCPESSFEGAF